MGKTTQHWVAGHGFLRISTSLRELRRRVHAELNEGEARNALAKAVFFNRLCVVKDRSFEQQRYRASGLNLVTIVLWNTGFGEQ